MKHEPIKLRAVFMGTSEFAATILVSLVKENYNLIAVYTQPDKKAGRDQEVKESAVKIIAEENKIPVFQPTKLNEETVTGLKNQKPDLIIVAAYGKILPKEVLEIPGFGAINVHASILPRFRGPSPIQNAILSGETETGITIMLMDKGIDTGDILRERSLKIKPDETTPELSKRLSELASKLLLETLPLWIERKITPRKQDDSKATLCQLIEKTDGKIIWADSAESIYNKFRAFRPWPGIYTFWEVGNSIKRTKLNKIKLAENISKEHHLGEVFRHDKDIAIQADPGAIIIEEIQMEGKPSVKIQDFLNGYPNFIGSILK